LLRNFRDRDVLRTSAGEAFMQDFNAFYYSFSPQVASYITAHSNLRLPMKLLLYPIVGILYASSLLFNAISLNSELSVTITGVFASFAMGTVYLGPLLTVLTRLRRSRSTSARQLKALQVGALAGLASLGGLLLAEIAQNLLLQEITTASVVLSFITVGGVVISWSLTRAWLRRQ